MLYDNSLFYKIIPENVFDEDILNLEEDEAELVSEIVFFYKNNDNNQIIKLTYSKDNDEREKIDLTDFTLLVKYYISHIESHNQRLIDIADLDYEKNYKIYNVGCFMISNLTDRTCSPIQNNIKEIFENYDLNFKNYNLPDEDEFIKNYNYKSKTLLSKKH